jgi:hypothetical protein
MVRGECEYNPTKPNAVFFSSSSSYSAAGAPLAYLAGRAAIR